MVKKIFAVVALALLFLLIIGASSAADIDINNDGTFSDVQNGINQARSGDTIYLNNHTFTGSGSEISVDGGWFSNKDKITIDGSINPNKGGTGNEMSILDAKLSSRVFNIGASSITLKNIIITNGKYSGRDANGAGVYSSGSNLVLENCVISNCEASSSSRGDVHSALYSENTVTLSRCTLVNNKATSTYNTVTNSYVVRTASFDGSMTDCIVRDNYVSSIGTMAIGITIVGSSSNKVTNTKFMNNNATSTKGNAFGAALQVLGTVSNCTFEYNQANSDVNNSHAGALCFRPGSNVYNCTFIGNIAYRGAATTFHASGELKDCIFINNTATGFGGAISTGYDGTTGQQVKISNSYFEGNTAPIGGAITTHGNDITVDNSTFISNKAADDGGAIYVVDDGITVLNSNFGNNSAKNYAGAIYVKGNNVKIQNATFVNNSAHFAGAVRVEGNYVNVLNATFIGNKAISDGVSKSQAGALGISGNNVNIDSSYFANNTAEGDAGAIGVKGSHIKVTNSQFYSNHADPFNHDLNTGLGGAIYTMGNNVTYDNAIFRYNTAVNGSALFVDGAASLKNIVFYRNQAYTYVLPIIVQNPKTPYGVTVNVTVVIIGGNNIANAIHHVGQLNDISFDNVTYLFNVNGTIMNRTTGPDELHPVDGVENSKNGTLIYRDERENTQSINPIVIYDENGNIIYNETLISSIYGDVRFSLSGLAPGNYTVKAEHPEDLFYKAIKNETNFEVVGFVDLDVNITTDKDYYGLDEEVEWTISLTNHSPHTDNYCYVNGIKLDDIVGFTPSKGTFDAATGVWNVGKLAKNEVVTLKVKTKTTSLGTITLTVNAVNSTEDTNISNNVATKTIYIQEQPKVVPTKDVNVTNPNYGDKVKYTIVISNVGKIAADVTLRDILDEGLIFAGASGNYEYDSTTRTITWNIGGLPVGQNLTFYVYATVNAYGVLNNTVAVGDNTFIRNVTVPEITPDKTIDNDSPNFGDNVSYTVTVTNNGVGDAKQVVVRDTLDKGLKFVKATGKYTFDESTNTVTWIVDLANGESQTFYVTAVAEAYGVLSNNVFVGDKSASADVTVPEIIPGKSVDVENPNFGDTVTYTVTVTNNGIVDAKNVVVVDHLDKGLKYFSSSNNGVYDAATHTVTWIVDIDIGSSIDLTVTAVADEYGVLTNIVSVGDKSASADVTVPEITPDKTVNITNPNFGDKVEYTITVSNNGVGDAKQVVVVDTLNEGLTFVSASDNGVWNPFKRTVTWTVDLAKGEFKVFNVIATVSAYGNILNTVVVGDKSSSVNIAVPEIIPGKSVDVENPNFGDTVTYTVVVTNDGVVDAKQVVVRDTLDKGLKFIKATGTYTWDGDSRTITWIVDLTKGESQTFYVTAVADEYGVLTNNVTVGDNTASADVTVPEITPDKIVDIINPNFGDAVTYTVTVTNNGIWDANNVVVKDVLGEGLKFVSATGEYTWDEDSRTVTWVVDLANGKSQTFYVTAVVESYGVLTNDVTVGDKSASVDVVVPEITPDKTVNITNPNFGDKVDYTIKVTNDGIGDANNIVVKDVLGEGLKFVSAIGEYTWDEDSRTIIWIVDLAKGESKIFHVIAVAEAYGVLSNNVFVGDKSASADVTVPEIIPDKTVSIANPNFGDNVTYTVTVSNDGIGDANNVVIVDRLGEGLTFVSASDNGVWDPVKRTVTWIVDLAKGESKVFTVNATVSGYGNVSNSLVVGNKTAGVNVTVPEINPDKTVNVANPNFGDDVTYTVTVSNDGIGDAKAVVVRDVLGEGLKFVSATGNYTFDEATNTITWIVDLAKGESKTFKVNATVFGYGNVTNSLVVGNKTAGVNVTVPEINPDKTVNVANPNFGDDVTYSVTVSNVGIGDAKGVVVKDTLGKGLKFISATGNYTFDEATNTIIWIVDLAKGESKTFKVNATVSGYGNVTNTVIVGNKTFNKNVTVPEINSNKTVNNEIPNFGDNVTYSVTVTNDGIGDANNVVVCDILGKGLKFLNADGNFTYDEKTGTITWIVDLVKGETKTFNVNVTVLSYGDLSNKVVVGNKTVIKNITVPEINPGKEINIEVPNFGDNVTYTVIVNNTGKVNATDVVVADKLGEGLVFVSASDGGVYNETTRTITWIINLTAGETKYLYVNTTVSAYGNITNSVIVGNKTFNKNVTVPEIIPVKEVNSSDIHIGDEINYTIAVSNPGKTNATNIVIKDVLPEGLKFINASNGGVYDPATGIITWIVNITANSTVDLTVVANVTKSGNITNTVNVGNKTANCTIESKDIADLEIHIVADKSEIYIGDSVVCTVTVINNGPSDAINTIANVFVPNTLSIISYNATKGTFDITSGKWYVGNLTNGEKVVLTFVAKALNEGNSTVYVNVTSETFEVILENNYDNVTVKVLKKAAPIGPDKPVHPDDSSSADDGSSSDAGSESVSLPNTGNPLAILLLCILSVIFAGSRKRKL